MDCKGWDYNAWSAEYWAEAQRVRERMALVRQEAPPRTPEEDLLRKRRLSILYGMYLECVHTARDLGSRAQRRGGL